ncbi:MAG: response regulator [Spirochaetota bacterium]|nr:MAG: response regulator [Spirochaetota bacterium]
MKRRKILVVDDDRTVLDSCKRVLEAEGFKVVLASSVKKAIDILEAEYFDLMILDVKMPKHDGMYLLEKIKEKWPLDRWPELPVVVMSGYPTNDTISESLVRGAADFLSKPFTPDELITSTNIILQRSKNHGKQ